MESGTSFSYKAKDPMSDERTLHVTDQSAKGKESAPKEWLSRNALHCIVFFTYLALVATVMCFHEPWFDEAQAWLIARDCSWKELLTVRPHYEGHPPLWWTMLAIPAKLGVPYEIGLKTINLVCAGFMIWLLEFKTAIPEILKAILPFSYFLCYQYGVTSRPYALMIAAMVLVAITWKTRDENPLPVVLSMMLLCLASSYGIVVSGVFAAYWTILLCRNRSLFKNKQCFFGLLALLLFAVALLIDILPAQGVYHGAFDYPDKPVQPKWITLLYLWLLIPSETLFTSYLSDSYLQFVSVPLSELLFAGTLSAMMWLFLIHVSRRRSNALLLLISYTVLSLVFLNHFSVHHSGIVLGLFISFLAIDCAQQPLSKDDWPQWCLQAAERCTRGLSQRKTHTYSVMLRLAGLAVLLISVYWTFSSSICDIKYDYSSAHAVASFIKKNNLEHYRWMASWERIYADPNNPDATANKAVASGGYCAGGSECVDYTSWTSGALILADPYFDHTIMANAYKDRSYLSWEWCVDPNAAKKDIATWKSWGEPEFYDTIYQPFFFTDLGYDRNHYTKLKIGETTAPWKDQRSHNSVEIYVRNDIYKNVLGSPDTGITWPNGRKR